VLAWDAVKWGAADPSDGKNVVLHEFAHQLDYENSAADGAPVRALARRPDAVALPDRSDKIEVVAGDLSRPDSLEDALEGAAALFLLGGFDTMADVLDRAGRQELGEGSFNSDQVERGPSRAASASR